MILKFNNFLNEEINGTKQINEGDRVICHGTIIRFNEHGKYNIDLEGKTGIVAYIRGSYRHCGVVFDNYFGKNILNDLDKRIKMNRGLWVVDYQLTRQSLNNENKKSVKFSNRFKKIFEYIEYLYYPILIDNINFIDITNRPDTISYLSNDRFDRLNIWNENDYDSSKLIYETPLRQEMKISRFIQMINPFTDKISLDKKINIYKSAYNNIILNKYNFKIVSGEEIRHWYDENNYHSGAGTLNKSCMRNSMNRLNIYCENPDKIKMLIMTGSDDKLMGRALVWNVDDPDLIYMDRPYTVFQEDVQAFNNYGIEKGWNIFDQHRRDKMIVKLKKDYGDSDRNPYMDTFMYFCIDGKDGENYLTTNSMGSKNYYIYDDA